MKLRFGAWIVMILIVVGEALIAFLAITEAGAPIGWAVAGFVLAGLTTAVFFWAFARTNKHERS